MLGKRRMRNMPRLCATILLLSLSWVSVTLAGQPHDSAWSVGYAQADITPGPKDVQMSGFGRERYAQGVLAPLISQMLVLRDRGGRTVGLITADVLEFERVMVEAIRRATTSTTTTFTTASTRTGLRRQSQHGVFKNRPQSVQLEPPFHRRHLLGRAKNGLGMMFHMPSPL